LEAFPSSGNIAAPFLGPVFGPVFGTTKEKTGAAGRSLRGSDFVNLLAPAASLPSAMQAAMDTHIYNTMRGHGAEAVLNQ
jgi:hypothetical protein